MIIVVIIISKKIMLFQKYVIFYPLVFIPKLTTVYLYFKTHKAIQFLKSFIILSTGNYFIALPLFIL